MKFNIRKIKLVSFLLSVIILSTTLNSGIFLNNNEIIDKATKDTKENVINTDPDGIHPIHTSSNSPPNANYFKFYKIITIDHNKVIGTENHTNFPLLFSILDADLYDKVQSDGDDIAFSNGTDWLDHEIELFDQDYGTRYAKLVAWVRIPTLLHNKDTIIYMYYGNSTMTSVENPSGVWDTNYKSVWHLSENPGPGYSGDIKDSTSNNNDGTAQASMTWNDQVEGKIDGSIDFDGSDDHITVPDSPNLDGSLNSTGEFTLVAWIYPRNLASFDGIMGSTKIQFCFDDDLYIFLYNPGMQSVTSSGSVMDANEWQQVAVTYNRTTGSVNLYHNGVKVRTGTINNADLNSAYSFYIGDVGDWEGGMGDGGDDIHGIIDEVRVSNIVRSSQWIATCYENQNDPSSFYSISTRYEVNPPKPEDFSFYKKITINHNEVAGSNDLIDFSLMISITDADLHNKVQSDGDDIAFWNGSEWLHHEIESFSQNYNSYYAKLVAWIRIPILYTSTDTIIYMYYGNPTMTSRQDPSGIWANDYEAVWHLDESSGSGAYIQDSSSNHHDGTPTGTQFLSSGKIDGARNLVGNGDNYIVMDQGSEIFNGGNRFTFSFWIYLNYVSDAEWDTYGSREIFYKTTSVRLDRIWRSGTGRGSFQPDIEYVDHGTAYRSVYLYRQQWTYITYTYDGEYQRPYVNGQLIDNREEIIPHDSNLVSDSSPFALGQYNTIKGYLDEFRVIKECRSGDWIETEYNNQNNPSEFYTVSRAYKAHIPSPEDFEYFKEITIDADKVSGNNDLIDFPLLISILDSDLKTDAQSDGDDILFSNGTDWLDHEIERYNPNYDSNNAQLIAWIRIPTLSSSVDTVIRMYYGNITMQSLENPSGVWNSAYMGVWHLLESSGTNVAKDSTSYSGFGDTSGTITKGSTGKIDGAYDFGTDGTIVVEDPMDDHLDFSASQNLTISFWINIDASTSTWQLPLYKGGEMNQYAGYNFETSTNGLSLTFYICDGSDRVGSPSTTMIFDTWIYITGVVNRYSKLIHMYKNGAMVGSGADITAVGSLSNSFDLEFPWADYDLNGLLDEIRISNILRSSDWIATEYNNQYSSSSFYSVGPEQTGFANIQVNAIDFYSNPLPNVNISIFNFTELKDSAITNNNGYVLFSNIPRSSINGYNFTVNMTSNIEPLRTVTINRTSEAIIIDDPFHNITLICNASRNIFSVEDVDGISLDSGWIIVSKDSINIQNCTIDDTGHTTFWWLNTSGYSYEVMYQDIVYDPNPVLLKSDVISAPNIPIPITVNLTTANFTIWTESHDQVISGVKLKIYNQTSSLINFTTNLNGKASFRWLTTNNNFNYTLNATFYGNDKRIRFADDTDPFHLLTLELDIASATYFDIEMDLGSVELEDFQTEIELLMSDSMVVSWGTKITLRTIFNVTEAGEPPIVPLGPIYADSMLYKIYKGSILILTGTIPKELDYTGRHQCTFETSGLEAKVIYTIMIDASKAEYVVPNEKYLSLYLLENEILLNQSENDDSEQTVYWLEPFNMSVTPYGEMTEEYILEQSIFQNVDHEFKFSIPDISSSWNLSEIIFNIYNITWIGDMNKINITIKDPYGNLTIYTRNNHTGWDIAGKKWIGIAYTLDKGSLIDDNSFNFTIGGSFDGQVDIITNIYFIRDEFKVQYSQFNITDTISLLSDGNGWVIKNITFTLYNCRNSSTWNEIDPYSAISKISTNEGCNYTFISHGIGTGIIIIENITIYPFDDQFLFNIINSLDIMFDVNISIEYTQGFYWNEYLETINSIESFQNIEKNSNIQIDIITNNLMDNGAILSINDIWNGTDYFLPSDLEMNITINGITYTNIYDVKGNGEFSLLGFNKDQIYTAKINTNRPVNFTLFFEILYSRMAYYEIQGSVTYSILGTDIINQPVQYCEDLRCYIQMINTSLLDANIYSPYAIRFTCSKENYASNTKDLDLRVLERLTSLGFRGINSTGFNIITSSFYVEDSMVYNFSFIDSIYGTNIQDLNSQNYDWKHYNTANNLVESGSGDLILNENKEYVLDFNTELKPIGRYEIWISLEKQNYESKSAIIIMTINQRTIDYNLGDIFEEKQTTVVKGKTIILSIELTDPTRGDEPLTDADVILEIGDEEFEFDEVDDGVYELEFDTDKYEAFFTSNTITGTIKISKANYTSEDIDITIVIGMEELEVIPGVMKFPTFYFLLIIAAIIAIVGSLATYKYIQQMRIPKFVKKAGAIRKAIKSSEEINASMLYPSKENYIISAVGDKWNPLGLSLESILGLKVKKGKKIIRSIPKIVIPERTADLTPLGLILMKWDQRIGTQILAKYPQDVNISQKTLMQIYGTHEYTGESGIITLMVGTLNLLSYYTGPENSYYLILILNFDDDPDAYEGAMADILRIILQNLEDDSYLQLIPSLFQRLSIFPNLTIEGHIAYTYQDEIKRMIINRLREEGVISKSELIVWLKDKHKEGFIDFESILSELMKMEIIKEATIKGIPSELIFLINDPFMLRIPPVQLLDSPEKHGLPSYLSETYKTEVKKFFQNYHPLEQDNINIIDMIIDPQIYETLKLLRTAIITKNDLEKLKKKGVTDYNRVLKILWEKEIIKVFQDKAGNEYYALLTDFYLDIIFPKYLLNIIKNVYDQKSKDDRILIEYLKILEDFYIDIKSR